MEEEQDVKAAPKELIDLIDRHERRFQPNIKSPLEVNLRTESEPKVVFVGTKLNHDLKTS